MEDKINNVEELKTIMIGGMVDNFKSDGYIAPTIFFLREGELIISGIPEQFLANEMGKLLLGKVIKTQCNELNTEAAGMIFEGYGKKVDTTVDDNLSKALLNGETKVSELDDKQDIVVIIIATPEKQEVVVYEVYPDEKKVGDLYNDGDNAEFGGTFSEFFKWEK